MDISKPLKLGNITVQTDKTLVGIISNPNELAVLLRDLVLAIKYEIVEGHKKITDDVKAAEYIRQQRGYVQVYERILTEALDIIEEGKY